MAACASSHNSESRLLECVHYLLDFGANIDVAERHRVTALMFASKEGRFTIVQCLAQAKADINKQDNKGYVFSSSAYLKFRNCYFLIRKSFNIYNISLDGLLCVGLLLKVMGKL